MKAKLVSILVILAFVAVPVYADILNYCKGGPAVAVPGEGGKITWINMCLVSQTRHWQGYAGKVFFSTAPQAPTSLSATGGLVNGSNINFTIPCDNPTYVSGFITFSNSSSPPIGLVAGDLSILDVLSGNRSDSGSNTFTALSTFDMPSGTVTNVPTTFSYVNETPQSTAFREGYFNQGNNIVFVTAIENNLLGYNRSYFDFQALLFAPNRTTLPYYIFADLNFICPPGGPGGGGGGYPGGCIVYWMCEPWGPCMTDGYQYRRCFPRIACPNMTDRFKPPTVRECKKQPREELPEIIPENKIFLPGILGNLSLNLTPDLAYIIEDKVLHGYFINNNSISIDDVTYRITTPKIYTEFAKAHNAPMVLWNTPFGGWKDHGPASSRALDWKVIPPEPLPILYPKSTVRYQFVVMPPVMQPKVVDIGVDAYSGPSRVRSTIAPLTVEVHPFQVAAEWRMPGVLTLYFVVDNRNDEGKDINIEVDLNRGKSTLEVELLGPLHVPADSVAIYGHEYRLGSAAISTDRVEATLVTKGISLKAGYLMR